MTSGIGLLVLIVVRFILVRFVDKRGKKLKMRIHETLLIKKMINLLFFVVLGVVLLSVWSLDTKDIWIFITSVLGLVAIGFVAVWSILSNVFAGVVLLANKEFKIGEHITVMPDNIKGTIKDISLMFVTLETKTYETYIPNSMMFQKFIKKKK